MLAYLSCEIRNEILKYSRLFDKRTFEQIAVIFNGVTGNSMGIDRLILDIKDDMIRSVSNRLAYLLILSNQEFAMIHDQDEGGVLITRLLTSLLSKLA